MDAADKAAREIEATRPKVLGFDIEWQVSFVQGEVSTHEAARAARLQTVRSSSVVHVSPMMFEYMLRIAVLTRTSLVPLVDHGLNVSFIHHVLILRA